MIICKAGTAGTGTNIMHIMFFVLLVLKSKI